MTYGLRLFAFFSLMILAAGVTSPAKLRVKSFTKSALTKKSGSLTLADDDTSSSDGTDSGDDDDNRATV